MYPPILFLEDQFWYYRPIYPSGLFPSGFTTKPSTHFLPPYLPKAPPPDIILLDFITCTIHIMQLPTMQSAAVNCYRMLSGPNIFLSNLSLNNLSLCSPLSMRHQASYNIKNRQHFSSVYINIHILLDSKQEVKT